MLAISYHFGASAAKAQVTGNPVVAVQGNYVFTANGDVYRGGGAENLQTWSWFSNVFSASTPTRQSSWGSIKVDAR